MTNAKAIRAVHAIARQAWLREVRAAAREGRAPSAAMRLAVERARAAVRAPNEALAHSRACARKGSR